MKYGILLILLLISGCSEGEPVASESQDKADVTETSSEPTTSAVPPSNEEDADTPEWAEADSTITLEDESPATETTTPTIETLDREGYDALLQKLTGKVVLVDFWATWCIPCRKSFPHTVELSENYKAQGLVVVTIACDDDIAEQQIEKFLVGQKATELENYRSAGGSEDQSFSDFEIGETGLPHYKVYARSGELIKTFFITEPGKPIDQDELEQTITDALALRE